MDGPDTPRAAGRGQQTTVQPRARRSVPWWAWALGLGVIVALVATVFWAARSGTPADGTLAAAPSRDVKALQQAVATAQKSDEVSRAAIKKLQDDLAAREAEIATLKEDLAFYERFVGTSAQRQPLGVESLSLSRREGQVWQFTAVVAQSAANEREVTGRLSFAVEGTQDGKLKKLAWAALRSGATDAGVPFHLKYFQRLSGEFVLPAGFTPTRITARVVPQQGAAVEESFAWRDVAH